MQRILDFLHANSPFYFSTMDGNQPRVRPFGMAMEFEGKLYFSTATHKPSYNQIKANPYVEICTANEAEGKWIRISGKAVFDERKEVVERIFEVIPMLRNMYSEESGLKMSPLYLIDGEAEISDIKGNIEKIKF